MFGPHGEANGVWRDDAHLIEDTLRTEEGINPNPNVTSEWASSLIGADWGVALVAKRRDASGCSQVQDGVPKWQTWERTTAPVKASHDASFHVTSVASDAMDARCYHLDHKLRTISSPRRRGRAEHLLGRQQLVVEDSPGRPRTPFGGRRRSATSEPVDPSAFTE